MFSGASVNSACSIDSSILLGNAQPTPREIDSETNTDFAQLRERLAAQVLEFEPEERRILGDSTAAGQLKDWSPRAIAREVEFLSEWYQTTQCCASH